MKKIAMLILFSASPCLASFFPPVLSTGGINGSTVAVTNAVGTNLGTNIAQINGAAVGTGATGIMKVALTDGAGNSITSAASALATLSAQSGTWLVAQNGSYSVTAGTGSFPSAVKVTSTTIPTAVADGANIASAGSNIGQVLVTGIPGGLILYSTMTLTTTTTERVLISSAGAATFTYLCGCVFTNSSATNASVTLRQSGGPGSAIAGNNFLIGVPANFVPAGVWTGCTNPFYRSSVNSNITITGSASVTSIDARCQYYVGP